MLCNTCRIDQARDQFGPSADQWPSHRECRKCSRRKASIRKHGIDAAQKAEIAAAQGGCRICGHPEPSEKGWVVDHDRSCCPGDKSCPKCRRGVICQWCNSVLGNAFDRPQILQAAIEYLARHRDCSWHMPVACAPGICGRRASGDATYKNGLERTHAEMVKQEIASPNASRAGGLTESHLSANEAGAPRHAQAVSA